MNRLDATLQALEGCGDRHSAAFQSGGKPFEIALSPFGERIPAWFHYFSGGFSTPKIP
jgi:hypothetical protein